MNLVVVTFPSHCTHVLQPLDLSFFKSLKAAYKRHCKEWLDSAPVHAGTPYLSKKMFFEIFYKAWASSATSEVGANGFKKMGLESTASYCNQSSKSGTDRVLINRLAVTDAQLGGSEKYGDETCTYNVRKAVGVDEKTGEQQYEDFTFDLSEKGRKDMANEDPRLLAMFEATRTHLMQQPGMAMYQRPTRTPSITKPRAEVLTTEAQLEKAKKKDAQKKAKAEAKKRKSLSAIGEELGVSVTVDGVDVVEEARAKRLRLKNTWCGYCMTWKVQKCRVKNASSFCPLALKLRRPLIHLPTTLKPNPPPRSPNVRRKSPKRNLVPRRLWTPIQTLLATTMVRTKSVLSLTATT